MTSGGLFGKPSHREPLNRSGDTVSRGRDTARWFNESQYDCLTNNLLNILHEGAELLVVNKPAGLVCHPTKPDGRSSLITRVRCYLGPETLPRLVNRLDRETSGVVLVAKGPEPARELSNIFASRAVKKVYLAIVHGHMRAERGAIEAPLGKDEHSCVAIKDCVRPDGAPAQTDFVVRRRFTRPEGKFTLLQLHPLTGRKHQLRIHLAHAGHPIVGDKLYGGDEALYLDFVWNRLTAAQRERLLLPFHALHAGELCFAWRGRERRFRADPEEWFEAFQRENEWQQPTSTPGRKPDVP